VVALHDIFVILYASVAVLAIAVTLVAWRHRAARGAVSVAALMLGVMIWAGAYAVMWSTTTFDQQALWEKVTSLGSWIVPVAFLTLAFDLARMERWRTPAPVTVVAIASFVLNNLEWINPAGQFNVGYVAQAIGPYTYYQPIRGPLYWTFIVYAYVLIIAAAIILLRVSLSSTGAERTEALVLLVGGLIPTVAGTVSVTGAVASYVDLAPISFLATGALWLVAIVRGTLLDIVPLARDVLVEQMSDGVMVVDGDNHVVDANPAALSILNAPRRQTVGEPADEVFRPLPGAVALLHGSGTRHSVLPVGTNDETRYLELGITPLMADIGRFPSQLVTLHDVTEERRASSSLRLARRVFDTANEGILVMRPNAGQQVIDVNDAYCRLTGRSREDTIGKEIRSLQSKRHPSEFYDAMSQTLFRTGEWRGEVWQTRVDGTAFPSWLSLSVARDDQGRADNIVGIFTDITQIRDAEEKLEFNATHDPLTGLPNRMLFDDRLNQAVAHARHSNRGLAVLFVDLDNFKDVNDSLGHAKGDAVLVEVSKRLAPELKESDTVGRLGGDEFAVMVTDVADSSQVEATARALLHAIASPGQPGSEDRRVTASIGVSMFPEDSDDPASLVQHADLAMYSAKSLGRNRIQFFSQNLQNSLDRRMLVERELWNADQENRYFLLYQPQVDLATGTITGAEALVRLRTKDGTVLSPAEFIPIAEDTEAILRLGDWVLRKACSDLALLHEVAPDLTVSVNLSARQFKGIDVAAMHEVLRETGVDPHSLALEITESSLMVDPRETAARLEDLRDMAGTRMSLDDFGTGYSSLTYVRMFHADTIKVDRSLVRLLPDDPDAQAIVLSTIALAKGLHATVIAEGPETEDQVRFLRAHGCDCAQGYYFSHPVPAEDLAVLLRSGPFALPEI